MQAPASEGMDIIQSASHPSWIKLKSTSLPPVGAKESPIEASLRPRDEVQNFASLKGNGRHDSARHFMA